MYENNFLYLFDIKKLTLLNYDNLKKYYVNFFYLDNIDLFSDLKILTRDFTKRKNDNDKYT